jgi:hypothetical protein
VSRQNRNDPPKRVVSAAGELPRAHMPSVI